MWFVGFSVLWVAGADSGLGSIVVFSLVCDFAVWCVGIAVAVCFWKFWWFPVISVSGLGVVVSCVRLLLVVFAVMV